MSALPIINAGPPPVMGHTLLDICKPNYYLMRTSLKRSRASILQWIISLVLQQLRWDDIPAESLIASIHFSHIKLTKLFIQANWDNKPFRIIWQPHDRLWSFKSRNTKFAWILLKRTNECIHRKLWYLVKWIDGKLSKNYLILKYLGQKYVLIFFPFFFTEVHLLTFIHF